MHTVTNDDTCVIPVYIYFVIFTTKTGWKTLILISRTIYNLTIVLVL